ncbi:MAG: DNA-binding protein [Candidatus Kapabacteria bacterium]|nr:DNA-binding protein [Candidatus Kapabacteria bacterium]
MNKDLTNSNIDRQNILNNPFALERIYEYVGFSGIYFDNEYRYTKAMVADFFGIDERTIDRYLENYADELKHNGYILMKGKRLKEFKLHFVHDINVVNKAPVLGLFSFRSVLNLAMLLRESENARILRSRILDIVIQVINEKTGGGTKYINQRDEYYIPTVIREANYRKKFTEALNLYVNMGNYKYALYTDKIYSCIFKEKAKEYKQILKLEDKINPRDTFYTEVLNLVASYESGIAYELEKRSSALGRKLESYEVDSLFKSFSEHPFQDPLLEDARIKMASRDYHFRQAFHERLEEYIRSIPVEDFERFLGEQSKAFEEQLEEAKDVLRRLKES